MKRYFILFLCFITLFGGCNFLNASDNEDKSGEKGKNTFTSAVDTRDNIGTIVYGRYGDMKQICSIDPSGEEYTELYQGDYDKVIGYGDKVIVYSKQDDRWGVYLFNVNSKELELITEGFRIAHKPAINSSGTRMAFYAYNTNSSEAFIPRIYCLDFNNGQPRKLAKIEGEIKHISFLDDDTIIYAKKDDKNNKRQYQIFSCSLKDETETQVMESASNDVNPVVSPDGKKIAFLSDRYKNYNLFVLNCEDNTVTELDLDDAVVGESLVWSCNSINIAYVALNGVTRYSIKLANINDKSVANIDGGYAVAFSPSGKSIIYASYSIDKEKETKNQVIKKRVLNSDKSQNLWEFPEESLYSRSINMLYWTNKLNI